MEGAAATLTTGAGPAAASLPDARHTGPDLGAAGAEGDEENMDYRYFRLPTGAERFPAPREINTPTNPAPIFSAAYAPVRAWGAILHYRGRFRGLHDTWNFGAVQFFCSGHDDEPAATGTKRTSVQMPSNWASSMTQLDRTRM